MRLLVSILIICFSISSLAQETDIGAFSLGTRSTISVFNHQSGIGTGVGGQFRIRFGKKINTEWFADYLSSRVPGAGERTDAHIGWSVMFYPFESSLFDNKIRPYLVAGHCFDYTTIASTSQIEGESIIAGNSSNRWSSAVQVGIGGQIMLSDNCDISIVTQYMSHLGNNLKYETTNGELKFIDNENSALSLEGHLLITVSLNIYLAKIFGRKC